MSGPRAEVEGRGGPVGVVVVHEVFGRDDYVRSVARTLAAAGFPAATVDLYDGKYARSLEEAFTLRGALTEAGVLGALDEAAAALSERLTGPKVVGTLGFCMGGGYALLGACRRPFGFAVDYYGRIERADDVAQARGPVLVLLASEDERITPWAFQELLPAAVRAKRRVSVELYPGVRHAFHRPGWEGHDPTAAADAWERTVEFLRQMGRAAPPSALK
ncbi:MAG TPA: dienelactone hydrolase family protein [Thermoplasmata archaeon]|nr:dienelactone hydrolase family protein [Thermoplasmata archaeon]